MNLSNVFEEEYAAYCDQTPEVSNNQIIKPIPNSTSIHIDLSNKNVHQQALASMSKLLAKLGKRIKSLDLSFNSFFNDSCVGSLEFAVKSCKKLVSIGIEKTGITDQGAIKLLSVIERIESLNVSSNRLTGKFVEKITCLFEEGKLSNLITLNISNIKMNEKTANALFLAVSTNSNIKELNLSMNSLKHKTGSYILNVLTQNSKISLIKLDLSYNSIAVPLLNAIEAELQSKRNIEYRKIVKIDLAKNKSTPKKTAYDTTSKPKKEALKDNRNVTHLKYSIEQPQGDELNELELTFMSKTAESSNKSKTENKILNNPISHKGSKSIGKLRALLSMHSKSKEKKLPVQFYTNSINNSYVYNRSTELFATSGSKSPSSYFCTSANVSKSVKKFQESPISKMDKTKREIRQQICKLVDIYSSIDRSFDTPKADLLVKHNMNRDRAYSFNSLAGKELKLDTSRTHYKFVRKEKAENILERYNHAFSSIRHQFSYSKKL
eukprot:TRINITY_DN14195_c0_g1_i10.p1 TRINITY_DN14195_c0_g1~~TRINITY_DN14195_c0_g1_i10.p1  ORF type:complete len:535 (-),score=85.80 TRINITY_DN14195_c0_g1_i10:141-1622(-)